MLTTKYKVERRISIRIGHNANMFIFVQRKTNDHSIKRLTRMCISCSSRATYFLYPLFVKKMPVALTTSITEPVISCEELITSLNNSTLSAAFTGILYFKTLDGIICAQTRTAVYFFVWLGRQSLCCYDCRGRR